MAIAIPRHERLSAAAAALIENMLKKNSIEYLSVIPRTKSLQGALEKIKRKEYSNPKKQLTDISGIRIVTYLEDQAVRVAEIVRDLFEIDEANSHDRSAVLGDDKIGYRSTHFVCTLGKSRAKLPEYEGIGNLKFEVQIRTVLQHAWAELAHDRSFKFGVALPSKIQRKLNLYSGMLEIVDGAFNEIANDIDSYKSSLAHKSINQISETEINSISVARFISELSTQLDIDAPDNTSSEILSELKDYGLRNIGDLQKLATSDFKASYKKYVVVNTSTGLLRCLMMFENLDHYFSLGRRFGLMTEDMISFLESKYPARDLESWLRKLDIMYGQDSRPRPAKKRNP